MSNLLDVKPEINGWRAAARPSLLVRRRNKMNKGWVLFPVLLLIGSLAIILAQRRQDAVPVSTEKAELRNIVHVVSGTGKIRPEHEVKISPEVAGEIVEMQARLGQRVKAGDLLVRINPDNYIAAVKQAEASLVAAKADSVRRRAEMENNDLDRHRSEELFAKKLISQSDYWAAETRASVSRAEYEASVAQIEVAQGNLDQSKELLQKCTIVSPSDGTIDSVTSEIGERVVATGSFPGTEMLRIADLESMQAWVEINENDIVKVRVGSRARVYIDAYPERNFFGVVERIAGRASVQNEGTQQEVTNFEVRVQILHPEVQIRPGMSARVEIQTDAAYQALSVPIQSVTVREDITGKTPAVSVDVPVDGTASSSRSDRVLFLVHGGSVRMAKVEVGVADDNYIQIISGIKVGDQVVAGPYTAISKDLQDGMAVKDDSL